MDLWVGCPVPQRVTLITDTGSTAIAFPCSSCREKCGATAHVDEPYNEHQSTCFRSVACDECRIGQCSSFTQDNATTTTCEISREYSEGSSWKAVEAVDRVYGTGGNHMEPPPPLPSDNSSTFDLHFGCQYRLAGLFQTQLADGIMGLQWHEHGFLSQMYNAGLISTRSFTLCYIKALYASREGTGAGAMILGGVDPSVHETPMVHALDTQRNGFYSIQIERMYLRIQGGESSITKGNNATWTTVFMKTAELNHGGVILDSGTTVTYLSEKLLGPFEEAWQRLMGKPFDHTKRRISKKDLEALPTIIFQVTPAINRKNDPSNPALAAERDPHHPDSILISFPPTHYMGYNRHDDTYIPAISFSIKAKEAQVLGANFFAGKSILFDIDNQSIGFSESRCHYHELGFKNFKQTDPGDLHHNILDYASDHVTPYQQKLDLDEDSTDTSSPLDLVSSSCSFLSCQLPLLVAFATWMSLLCFILRRRLRFSNEETQALVDNNTEGAESLRNSINDKDK